LEDALAKRRVLAHIEQQPIELLGRSGRMFIKFEALVFESETSVFLRNFLNWLPSVPGRNEAHHAMAVMPSWRVLQQFSRNWPNRSQHDGPIQHLRVAGFVQLLRRQVQHGIGISDFELSYHP